MRRLICGLAAVALAVTMIEGPVGAQDASGQTPLVQQSVLAWGAYVEPALIPPQTALLPGQQFAAYVIYRGIGSTVCMTPTVPLTIGVMTINKAVAPAITPTSWVDTGYPDQNGIVCWEIYVKFADGTLSLRSKRLIKEIISTKPSVPNPTVQ